MLLLMPALIMFPILGCEMLLNCALTFAFDILTLLNVMWLKWNRKWGIKTATFSLAHFFPCPSSACNLFLHSPPSIFRWIMNQPINIQNRPTNIFSHGWKIIRTAENESASSNIYFYVSNGWFSVCFDWMLGGFLCF